MKTILVPVDFSEESKYALDFAFELNEKTKGKIILFHVLEISSPNTLNITGGNAPEPSDFFTLKFIELTRAKLHLWADQLIEQGAEVEIHMKVGNMFQNMQEVIANQKTDLILIGSKGASGIKELLVGSNAEKVIRHASCPVITIKQPTKLSEIKNLVFATNLYKEQDKIVASIKDFQQLLGFRIYLVYVVLPFSLSSKQERRSRIDRFILRNNITDAQIEFLEADYTEKGIVNFSEKIGASMIALATHGKTGLAHIIGGSRAEDVANLSKVPVLTLKL